MVFAHLHLFTFDATKMWRLKRTLLIHVTLLECSCQWIRSPPQVAPIIARTRLPRRRGLCGTVPDVSPLSRILHCRLSVPSPMSHFLWVELSFLFQLFCPQSQKGNETDKRNCDEVNVLIQTWFLHTKMREMASNPFTALFLSPN